MRTATLLLLIGPAVGWKLRELAASDCVGKTVHGERAFTDDPEDKYDSCDADTWHGRTCDRASGGSSCDKCDMSCDKTGRNCCDGSCDGCCDDNCPGDPMPPQLPSPAHPPSLPPHPPSPPFSPPPPPPPPNPPAEPPKGGGDDEGLSAAAVAGIVLGSVVAVVIIVGVAYYVYKRYAASSERGSAVATVDPATAPSKRVLPRLFLQNAFAAGR